MIKQIIRAIFPGLRKILIRLFQLFFILFVIFQPRVRANEKELKFGHISVEDAFTIQSKYQPLLDILSAETGYHIELIQKEFYAEMNTAFTNGEIDMGILNAFSYIQIAEQAGILPVARRVMNHSGSYRSYIITRVREDNPIKNYQDLKGKIFAFSDPDSTTGYLVPSVMLIKNGITLPDDLKNILYLGEHDSVIYAVLNRTVDAGAVASYIFEKFETGIRQKLIILDESALLPLGPFVIRKNMEVELREKIKSVLLDLKNYPGGPAALEAAGLDGFEKAGDKDYNVIRRIRDDSVDKGRSQ